MNFTCEADFGPSVLFDGINQAIEFARQQKYKTNITIYTNGGKPFLIFEIFIDKITAWLHSDFVTEKSNCPLVWYRLTQ